MVAFAAFCAVVGGLVEWTGTAVAFALATLAAMALQAAMVQA